MSGGWRGVGEESWKREGRLGRVYKMNQLINKKSRMNIAREIKILNESSLLKIRIDRT